MAGLAPATHDVAASTNVDVRDGPGHDDLGQTRLRHEGVTPCNGSNSIGELLS
jgi:hypothetical protein